MAVINFPDPSQSPWTNELTGITYTYDNGVWKVTGASGSGGSGGSGGASITVDITPPDPTTVQEGALWWNSSSDDTTLYVLYVDPDTDAKYWVEASPSTAAVDLTNYNTSAEVDTKIASSAVDLSAYNTSTEVDTKIASSTINLSTLPTLP
tara:strand:- start:396 stop:848 length:453 start_codon:yes stop_codon:yes gene_type:complete